jgi:hypothetical protein
MRQKGTNFFQHCNHGRVPASCGAHPARSRMSSRLTYLLPLGLNLSLGSEIRLHGLRRSEVVKTGSAASSMDAGGLRAPRECLGRLTVSSGI